MAKYSIELRTDKVDKKGECPIRIRLSFTNERMRLQPPVRTNPKFWDESKSRIRKNYKHEEYNYHIERNQVLDDWEKKIKGIINYADSNQTKIDKAYFQNQWTKKIPDQTANIPFFTAYDEFIEVNKPIKALRTIKGYKTAYNFLKDFEKAESITITFDNLNLDVFERFRTYAFEERKILDNYFSKLIRSYKAFLNWSFEKKLHDNQEFLKFKAPEKEGEVICLFKDELMHLYEYQFENKKYERVRDIYCFGCFTGLRISDIMDLKPEHIQGGFIKKSILKTRVVETIQLNKFALAILEKYKGLTTPLPKISSQKFNDYIKEAAEIAEINTPITKVRYSGGRRIETTVPKCKLITSHTARKTFITNSLILGMSETAVKKLSGHKKDTSFRKYVNLSEEYLKEEMKNTWDMIGVEPEIKKKKKKKKKKGKKQKKQAAAKNKQS